MVIVSYGLSTNAQCMFASMRGRSMNQFLWESYGWNSVRKFGRLRGTYVELRATQSTCSIAFATLIDIKLCDTNLIHSFLIVP